MCEPISLGQSFFTSFPISHGTSREVCCHSRQARNILPQPRPMQGELEGGRNWRSQKHEASYSNSSEQNTENL